MLEAEDILNGVLRGALGGGRKRGRRTQSAFRSGGLVNAKTLLAAAGVAWGLYETWQAQQASGQVSGGAAPGAPGVPQGVPPPLPRPGSSTADTQPPLPPTVASQEASIPEPVARLLRIMISAARADGELGPSERERIVAEAREVGAEALVMRELEAPRPLGELVTGVTDPQLKEQLYTLAFAVVRADEAVTGGERIYLAQLANRLGLDAAAVARIEAEAAARIDAATA